MTDQTLPTLANSGPIPVNVSGSAPSAPVMNVPVDSQGVLRTDNPVITGTGIPQAAVTIFANGKAVGTGSVDGAGYWAVLTDSLAIGPHSLTVTQTNAAGQTSAASEPIQARVELTASGLKFDMVNLSAVGVTADRQFIQNMLDDTAARFSEFIDGNQTISVSVNIKDLGDAVGSAGSWWPEIDKTGMPVIADTILNLSSRYTGLFTESDQVSPYLYAHEMLHALGFNGNLSYFQEHVKVQSDGVYFVGPNAVALNGAPVRLDSSHSHFPGEDDLMGPAGGRLGIAAFSSDNPWAPFSSLDIAILKDIGWTTKPVLVSADGHTFVAGSGKAGFDQVNGTAGIDTFFLDENRANFTGMWEAGKYKILDAGSQTSHTLSGIERVQFADKTVALDVNGNGGQMYRLYQAVFGRTPDEAGLGFWIKALDNGLTLSQAADQFAASSEFKTLYGAAPTADQIVTKLYANVLHRAPDQAGYEYWLPIIKNNPSLVEEVLVAFSESAENVAQVAKIIGNGFEYLPYA